MGDSFWGVLSVLAIDPGAKTGWALFQSRVERPWHLAACGVVCPQDHLWLGGLEDLDLVVIENPQIYPSSKVPPNDILTLARIVGRYEERFAGRAERIELVKPREWKGSVNGDIMARRIESALSAYDKDVMRGCLVGTAEGYRHNAIDAIGLAQWTIKQRRLCPRAEGR
jgi:hypothetical protein